METIVQTLIDLLSIESITGNEKQICDFTYDSIRSSSDLVSIRRIENSLVVFGPQKPGRQTVILAGHFDTVPGKGFGTDVCVKDDRVIGLGASDMKGGLAVMRELLDRSTLQNSRFNIIQVYYHGEEYLYETNGIHTVFKQTPELKDAAFSFLLEPTNGDLHLGCMGLLNVVAKFHGKRAHSARPWEGENAIHKAAPFMNRIREQEPLEIMSGGLSFTEVMSITLADGGVAQNVIPDEFKMTINMRIAPGTTLEDGFAKIKQLAGGVAELKIIDSAPSCLVPEKSSILDEFKARYNMPIFPKQAYNDVAVFGLHGIPAVSFGPGLTAQAHKAGEYVMIDNLISCLKTYRSFFSA
jgi:succinyl-diaminopimelate desuccinylase